MPKPKAADTGGVAADQLRSIVERIERMNEEIKASNEDKKEIFAEAKGNGFDTKIIKKVVQLRAKSPADRQEEETILELYLRALGMSNGPDDDPVEDPRPRAPAHTHAREEVTITGSAGSVVISVGSGSPGAFLTALDDKISDLDAEIAALTEVDR